MFARVAEEMIAGESGRTRSESYRSVFVHSSKGEATIYLQRLGFDGERLAGRRPRFDLKVTLRGDLLVSGKNPYSYSWHPTDLTTRDLEPIEG